MVAATGLAPAFLSAQNSRLDSFDFAAKWMENGGGDGTCTRHTLYAKQHRPYGTCTPVENAQLRRSAAETEIG